MSTTGIVNVVGTVIILIVGFYLANRVARNSQVREEQILVNGRDVTIAIMSMKQSGLFINNNPVIEMSLRLEEPGKGKSWVVEKHDETAWLIAVASYNIGSIYQGKIDDNNRIAFVKDPSGKPLLAQ